MPAIRINTDDKDLATKTFHTMMRNCRSSYLEITVREMDKRLTNQIEELDKRLTARIDVLFWAISALIGLVLAVIALPQLLEYFQEK